jgi:hypothetical protein
MAMYFKVTAVSSNVIDLQSQARGRMAIWLNMHGFGSQKIMVERPTTCRAAKWKV